MTSFFASAPLAALAELLPRIHCILLMIRFQTSADNLNRAQLLAHSGRSLVYPLSILRHVLAQTAQVQHQPHSHVSMATSEWRYSSCPGRANHSSVPPWHSQQNARQCDETQYVVVSQFLKWVQCSREGVRSTVLALGTCLVYRAPLLGSDSMLIVILRGPGSWLNRLIACVASCNELRT